MLESRQEEKASQRFPRPMQVMWGVEVSMGSSYWNLAWAYRLWECRVTKGKCEKLRDGRAQGLTLRLVLYRSQTVDRESYPRPVIEKALHRKSGKHCLACPVLHPVHAQTGPLISK